MYRNVIDRFLGAQHFARQTKVLMGSIERHSRETCKDDLHNMGSRFQELPPQVLECFCGYNCKRGILLSPGHNATMERGLPAWCLRADCRRSVSGT